jgi:hypothetical protein
MSVRACANALEGHDERRNWNPTDTPAEGDAVLMARGKHPIHIGLPDANQIRLILNIDRKAQLHHLNQRADIALKELHPVLQVDRRESHVDQPAFTRS